MWTNPIWEGATNASLLRMTPTNLLLVHKFGKQRKMSESIKWEAARTFFKLGKKLKEMLKHETKEMQTWSSSEIWFSAPPNPPHSPFSLLYTCWPLDWTIVILYSLKFQSNLFQGSSGYRCNHSQIWTWDKLIMI